MKKADSNEKLDQVIEQIIDYENLCGEVRENIEREIQEKYHWKEFRFYGNTQKMILAHRRFFKNASLEKCKDNGICFCSFSDIRANNEQGISLLEKFGSKGLVRLKIENR